MLTTEHRVEWGCWWNGDVGGTGILPVSFPGGQDAHSTAIDSRSGQDAHSTAIDSRSGQDAHSTALLN
ncbi:MAG: hypothetical protein F6K26_11060 [Moorea sp. SIO2I5]|nr:hypothetical protein [Moorena sp. SIO2I5]